MFVISPYLKNVIKKKHKMTITCHNLRYCIPQFFTTEPPRRTPCPESAGPWVSAAAHAPAGGSLVRVSDLKYPVFLCTIQRHKCCPFNTSCTLRVFYKLPPSAFRRSIRRMFTEENKNMPKNLKILRDLANPDIWFTLCPVLKLNKVFIPSVKQRMPSCNNNCIGL